MVIVTNGLLTEGNFIDALSLAVHKYRPNAVYLRELHLNDEEYIKTAQEVIAMLKGQNIKLFISHRVDIARQLNVGNIHISYKQLANINFSDFNCVSVAVHSVDEVVIAEKLGANVAVYGHIFETDCKPNSTPCGLMNLHNIVQTTRIPVIAIGGITAINVMSVLDTGVSDFAVMSSAMKLNF